MSSELISFRNVSKTYFTSTNEVRAIGNFTAAVKHSEFVSIVGPSGCGKSSILNMLAGFFSPTSGEIMVDGAVVQTDVPQGLGYIFQKDTVLPWYTVGQNVGLALEFKKRDQKLIDARVDELLKIGHLDKFKDSYPYQLSGGMRRRVALLMSLAADPRILLLDEPFGALDTHTKTHLHRELLEISRRLNQTCILVTHDLDEAIALSDRVIVLSSPPSRVLLDQHIDIPHPRDVFTVRNHRAFTEHYTHIWSVLGQEFQKTEISA